MGATATKPIHPPLASTAAPQEETRDVKLRRPMYHLIRLHGFKVVRRTTMSHMVTAALEQYFATTAASDLAAVAGRAQRDRPDA